MYKSWKSNAARSSRIWSSAGSLALSATLVGCGSDTSSTAGDDTDGGESSDASGTAGSAATMSGGSDSAPSGTSGTTGDTAGSTDGDTDGIPTSCGSDTECDDGNACNGVETCVDAGVCQPGAPPEGAVPCNGNGLCVDGACVPSTCGNGEIEGGEQCDDANQTDYDGCSANCRFELFFRRYELELMPSPAASFCDRPTSALGDVMSSFALAQNNADRAADIDLGIYNAVFQVTGLDDLSGESTELVSFYSGYLVPDPDGPAWPTDGSNPADAPFLITAESMAPDGRMADRTDEVEVSDGVHIGGPGTSLRPTPELVDVFGRGRFSMEVAPDVPEGGPALAPGTVVVKEVIADGDDEGFCGTLTVDFLARQPVDADLADCLECPGESHSYVPCPGNEVTDSCNSGLDPIVGGCIIGANCAAGFNVITPTQPDVDHGGPAPLVPDPENFNKIPVAQTMGSTNGYSTFFKYRARRVRVTGVAE